VNERIKELIKQAGDYVNEVYTPPVRSKTPGKIWEDGHVGWHTQFNEKFAELIVRECAHVAVFKDDGRNVEGYMEIYRLQGRSTAAKMIKEHFGVEE
jgi:hypothetical protein